MNFEICWLLFIYFLEQAKNVITFEELTFFNVKK